MRRVRTRDGSVAHLMDGRHVNTMHIYPPPYARCGWFPAWPNVWDGPAPIEMELCEYCERGELYQE